MFNVKKVLGPFSIVSRRLPSLDCHSEIIELRVIPASSKLRSKGIRIVLEPGSAWARVLERKLLRKIGVKSGGKEEFLKELNTLKNPPFRSAIF